MPFFRIKTRELWSHDCEYMVEAEDEDVAIEMVDDEKNWKNGKIKTVKDETKDLQDFEVKKVEMVQDPS